MTFPVRWNSRAEGKRSTCVSKTPPKGSGDTLFHLPLNPSRFLREPPSASKPALTMTTSPHNPMLSVQVVAAEQRVRSQHPPESHDAFLARRHAERPPRVSSLTPKPMSSFDLPADRDSANHHADDGCECDAHTPSGDSPYAASLPASGSPTSDLRSLQGSSPYTHG